MNFFSSKKKREKESEKKLKKHRAPPAPTIIEEQEPDAGERYYSGFYNEPPKVPVGCISPRSERCILPQCHHDKHKLHSKTPPFSVQIKVNGSPVPLEFVKGGRSGSGTPNSVSPQFQDYGDCNASWSANWSPDQSFDSDNGTKYMSIHLILLPDAAKYDA